MVFAIITHVPHGVKNGHYFAYAPYVREMNIWTKFTNEVFIVAPLTKKDATEIDINYEHKQLVLEAIPEINLLSARSALEALLKIPGIMYAVFKAMKKADHIHLRCPGNIGLIGCIIQMLFPHKTKTAKYAGNWDPNANQPWSYRLQRCILNNTFLTKNMQVLVYGRWPDSSKNVRPFFTASYREEDKIPILPRSLDTKISFVFAGTLLHSKGPIYAVKLVQSLYEKGYNVNLSLVGDGPELENIRQYILVNQLQHFIRIEGNQTQETVKKAFQQSHFVVLPSKSEGWPKVIAEGMFWGCVPIASNVSCIGFMLDYGNRGVLLKMELEDDAKQVIALLNDPLEYRSKVEQSIAWSGKYTLNLFENEIKALLNPCG